ncbi:MAG: prephenate dehydrogenase [Eubacteriales bacterium]|jgi:prephenate dehydrogenase
MNIGIAGLGLIGGSAAKAYKEEEGNKVYALDTDKTVFEYAKISGAVDGILDKESLKLCDCVLIALYPVDAIEYLKKTAPEIKKETIVIDFCGVKRIVCDECFPLAEEYGFTFVGGHPMAGTQNSGFKASRASLFAGASMLLVPPRRDDIRLLERIKKILAPLGFGRFVVTTPELHDEMIAYTSQLAHVVSSAYAMNPAAQNHKGYSAGSYKDLTRVARLNVKMWTELFMANRDNLAMHLELLIEVLEEYKAAISKGDEAKIAELLEKGRVSKQEAES